MPSDGAIDGLVGKLEVLRGRVPNGAAGRTATKSRASLRTEHRLRQSTQAPAWGQQIDANPVALRSQKSQMSIGL
jgi:hypothetical protein